MRRKGSPQQDHERGEHMARETVQSERPLHPQKADVEPEAPKTITTITQYLEMLSYLVLILSVPYGLWQYMDGEKKERAAQRQAVYREIDNKFTDFLALALEH